jgi:hypothetical protein
VTNACALFKIPQFLLLQTSPKAEKFILLSGLSFNTKKKSLIYGNANIQQA